MHLEVTKSNLQCGYLIMEALTVFCFTSLVGSFGVCAPAVSAWVRHMDTLRVAARSTSKSQVTNIYCKIHLENQVKSNVMLSEEWSHLILSMKLPWGF